MGTRTYITALCYDSCGAVATWRRKILLVSNLEIQYYEGVLFEQDCKEQVESGTPWNP